jgi:thiamine pyrophosphokinase
MIKATVLLAGNLTVTERLRGQIAGSHIIAADGGMIHAKALGVVPDLWVGDFDSADEVLLQDFSDVPRKSFPAAKDTSDGALAMAEAIAAGATRIILVGAFGGRADHSFAVLLSLFSAQLDSFDITATSGKEEAFALMAGEVEPDWPGGTTFSILPITNLDAITIEGARWQLTDRNVPLGDTLTLSNNVTGDLRITLKSGRALAIAQL